MKKAPYPRNISFMPTESVRNQLVEVRELSGNRSHEINLMLEKQLPAAVRALRVKAGRTVKEEL